MKNYLDQEYKEEIIFIIKDMLDDSEFWNGGITRMDHYLQTSNKWLLTEKQAREISKRLNSLVNKMCMRISK
jgi:hypothetical protein